MPETAKEASTALKQLASPERARVLARYFKTGPGEYGEGDIFIGLTVPQTRSVAKAFKKLPLAELEILLHSPIHEERLAALLILVAQFEKAEPNKQKEIVNFYLKNTHFINNWDLVDSSAHTILGVYLEKQPKDLLYKLANSKNLWERRIAIIATFNFIRQGESNEALSLAEQLLSDSHDLIHKAVGWMLREVGKTCGEGTLRSFLKRHYSKLPRTTLRYAIEKFPEAERKAWLKGPFEPDDLQTAKPAKQKA